MLQTKNINLVRIGYENNKGLLLKWNLLNKSQNYFSKHIIVLDVQKNFDYSQFVLKYYHKIKHGDIISVCYLDTQGQIIFTKIKQKSNSNKPNYSNLCSNPIPIQKYKNLLSSLKYTLKQIETPIFINFLTNKCQQDIRLIQKLINSQHNLFLNENYILNFFGKFQSSSISVIKNINLFNDESIYEDETWQYFRYFLNEISYLSIRITIQCQNGIISSQNQQQWKMIEFNKIQRHMITPSNSYKQDIIYFVNQDQCNEIKYKLNITLQYKDLELRVYKASKLITIQSMNQKVYQRTHMNLNTNYGFQIIPGLYSSRNPFQTQTLVWFKKNNGI